MQKVLEEILNIAVNAPSGHNSQPWRFSIKEGVLLVSNIPNKDKTLFNYKQRGSFIAHGAVIENIAILASTKGLQANITILPEGENSDVMAEIQLQETSKKYPYEHLAPFITQRTTNRKPYAIHPLKDTDKQAVEHLFDASQGESDIRITLTEDRDKIRVLAHSFSAGDRLIFENEHIHTALFSNVNWTLKDEQRKREGLYVMTKELSSLERTIFKHIFSRWGILKKLQRIGLPEKAAQKRQKLYEHCSAMGVLTAPNDSPRSFIEAGRALQKLWLTATSLELSFQPVSVGLLYLGQQVQEETPEKLLENQRVFVKKAYEKTLSTLSISNRVPAFSFRVGYASPPTASSLKKEAIISRYMDSTSEQKSDLSNVGLVFISPIIGLTPSMMAAFQPLVEQGAGLMGIDIFDAAHIKKTMGKILGLTILPRANSRRIALANSFPEDKVFDAIENAIQQLIQQGKTKVVLGGMSGGFIFAGRVVQSPNDQEIANHRVRKLKDHVVALFGVSPLIFYPKEMKRPHVYLENIPAHVQTLLFFGDNDKIIPPKTMDYAKDTAKTHQNVHVKILERKEFGKSIQHQFFGGKDFVGPMKNPFWHQEAEKHVIKNIEKFLKSLPS